LSVVFNLTRERGGACEGETYDRTMHDDDGMRMTIRYYYDDERATPDSRDTC
jgi:hypothetical protein